jgi:hemerythrin
MNPYIWKESFNTGVADIDQDHREFLALVNKCEEKCDAMKSSEFSKSVLDQLKLYATKHFRQEEKLMEAHYYPETVKQRQMHAYFESQVEKMSASQDKMSPNHMFSFIRGWFLQHIMEEDVKFAQYLK